MLSSFHGIETILRETLTLIEARFTEILSLTGVNFQNSILNWCGFAKQGIVDASLNWLNSNIIILTKLLTISLHF